MAILEVNKVCKSFAGRPALDQVSFAVEKGELFGLLGPNGAGKTTLLSIISCLLKPDQGTATLDKKPVTLSDRSLRRMIGIVPQELAIYGELTARENLTFFGELYGVKGAGLTRRVAEVLDAVGLTDRAGERASTFSGGMKRRLNLGAALVHDPLLLLLDEPTTGVDPQSRNHIFEEVRRLNAAGMTIVYTSHYMEEVQALCRRVGILDQGKLIACDSVTELLRHLPSSIHFRIPAMTPTLRERLKALPQTLVTERPDGNLELECQDATHILPQLLTLLGEAGIPLSGLEINEPNLELVFLHLTGRALRD